MKLDKKRLLPDCWEDVRGETSVPNQLPRLYAVHHSKKGKKKSKEEKEGHLSKLAGLEAGSLVALSTYSRFPRHSLHALHSKPPCGTKARRETLRALCVRFGLHIWRKWWFYQSSLCLRFDAETAQTLSAQLPLLTCLLLLKK